MSKITDYVVKGCFADNEAESMQRLAYLFESNPELMKVFVNGIPVSVEITDKEGLLEEIRKSYKDVESVNRVEFEDEVISGPRRIHAVCDEKHTRYYKTQESADRCSCDCEYKQSDEYHIEKTTMTKKYVTMSDKDMKYLHVEYL